MQGENKEHWKVLCEQAATEQDPVKLLALIKEIDKLLLEKEERLLKSRILLLCSICQLPVLLESDKDTDNYGNPIHESCYAKKMADVGNMRLNPNRAAPDS